MKVTFSVEPPADLRPTELVDGLAGGLTDMRAGGDFGAHVAVLVTVDAARAEMVEEAARRNGITLKRVESDGEGMTYGEAMQNALDWAEGRKSHWNEFLNAEPGHPDGGPLNRPLTLGALAQADAAEVVKWTAIARVLADEDQLVKATAALDAAIDAASPSERWIAIPHEQWRGLLAAIPHKR